MVIKSGAECGLWKRNDFAVRTVLKFGIQNNFFDQIGFSEKFPNCGMNLHNLRMGLKIKK